MGAAFRRQFRMMASIWGGCLVVLFFVYMYVLSPQKKARRQIEKELAEKKQMYDLAQKAAEEKTKIQSREQIERLQCDLNSFVIDLEDSANLTLDIGQIASEKGVALSSIKGESSRKNSEIPGCKQIGQNYINVSFVASFNKFAAFLNALERHRPVVFIDKFVITRSDQGASGHAVDMELAVFVKKQEGS